MTTIKKVVLTTTAATFFFTDFNVAEGRLMFTNEQKNLILKLLKWI